MRLKSASLNAILQAVGKPTGDQLIKSEAERVKAEKYERVKKIDSIGRVMTSQERKNLVKMYKKAGVTPPWFDDDGEEDKSK